MSRLCFSPEGRVRLMQFTDFHIGSLPHHEDDYKSFAMLDRAIQKLKPDLIVGTGDQIWSDGVKDLDIIYRELLTRLTAHHIPIALVYGNHDAEGRLSRDELRAIEAELPMGITKEESFIGSEGRENYILGLYDEKGEELLTRLYFLDSGQDAPIPVGTYNWLQFEQVEWFRKCSKQAEGRGKRDLVFMHIPLPEYWQAAEHIEDGLCLETNEMISAPHLNTGFFAAARISEQVAAIFAGHDHENNFRSTLEGVQLIYGQVSGYQCYGDLPRGVRVVDLFADDRPMKTWTVTDAELQD